MLHAANILQATKIRGCERDAATFLCILPDSEGAWLTVAHFENEGPLYDGAPSWLGSLQGPLLVKFTSGPAAAYPATWTATLK